MGKPNKKLKKILFILGITGAVYGTFRFLLPLVVPFLAAWALALVLRPSSSWLARRCQIKVYRRHRGKPTCQREGAVKVLGPPVGLVGVAELLVVFALLSWAFYFGGRKLCLEAGMFLEQIPYWVEEADQWLTALCHQVEDCFCLNPDCMVILMREMLKGFMESLKKGAMPYLMVNSVSVFRWGIKVMVMATILLVAIGMALQEMEVWKKRCLRSAFRQEYSIIGHRLAIVANAYLKTQGVIMLLTTVVCTAGLWFLKNPYYILAGVGIGILDALPVFGTGTVLIPWAVLQFVKRKWVRGLVLLGLYFACYLIREFLEAKMMGDQVGLSPLETLISIYVGLQLFGVLGLFLGPVGLLLIEDLVEHFTADDR
ncbi:MAG: AI-2E family transporter [Lachnospiraceae bacterium]|nr:AI-2E family transporter [Lachnospiraceae bacterium]